MNVMIQKEKNILPFNDLKTIHGVQGIILYSEEDGIHEKMIPESFDDVEFHNMSEGILSSLLQARHHSPEVTTMSVYYQNYTVYVKRISDNNLYIFVLGELDMDINLLDIALTLIHPIET